MPYGTVPAHAHLFFKKTRVSKVSESLDAEGIWMCAHTMEIQWVISLDYQSVWTGTLGPGWTVNNEFSHEHQRLFDTIEQSVLLVLKKSDKWQLHLKCRSHEPLSPLRGYKSWEAVASYTLNTELSSILPRDFKNNCWNVRLWCVRWITLGLILLGPILW